MDLAWYALLGLFFASYLVLAGYDYGVGLLLARGVGPAGRRAALTALGPFFLGNEVWLVAAVGILFGAFPLLEGELLAGCYPAVVGALVGVILVTVGVQLRSRPTDERRPRPLGPRRGDRQRRSPRWAGARCSPRCSRAYPCSADGHVAGVAHLATPFAAAAGLAMVALVAVHGATFLTLRLSAEAAAVAGRTARRLVPVALAAVALATVAGPALRPGTRRRAAAGTGRTPAGAARGGAAGGPRGADPAAAGVGSRRHRRGPGAAGAAGRSTLSGPTCWCPRPTPPPR